MPHFCIDIEPVEYLDRTVHETTPGVCDHLPLSALREDLGWHEDILAAVAKARFWYKTAAPCIYCYAALRRDVADAIDLIETDNTVPDADEDLDMSFLNQDD